jgi:predicted RNA binding protein YcfA (HicA-like mRNA interferase family)
MTRLPACTPAEVIRALERAGFVLHHSTGSHRFFKHPVRPGYVTVAYHGRDLDRKTLHSILKQAGLSRDEFLKLL